MWWDLLRPRATDQVLRLKATHGEQPREIYPPHLTREQADARDRALESAAQDEADARAANTCMQIIPNTWNGYKMSWCGDPADGERRDPWSGVLFPVCVRHFFGNERCDY